MTHERLTTIVDAYGADPERWPATERADALALIARSADARALLADAARLDDVMNALPPPATPSPALRARIGAAAPARPTRRRVVTLLAPLAAAATVFFWLARTPETVSTARVTVPMAALGVYETPTDSLLTFDELDVAVDDDPSLTRAPGRRHA